MVPEPRVQDFCDLDHHYERSLLNDLSGDNWLLAYIRLAAHYRRGLEAIAAMPVAPQGGWILTATEAPKLAREYLEGRKPDA